jgi:tetratricopeptide (TPR) repeat protein
MSRTLNLCEHLLAQGRQYHTVGALDRAQRILTDLARLRDLPAHVAEETQSRLAELLLNQRQFARARRHLAAAMTHDANNPFYHHLMAVALEEDRNGDRDLALQHYRRCVELEPQEPVYLCDAGLFALKHGAVDEGLEYLRHTVELAPDDVDVIGEVVRGLQDHGHHDEARQIAKAALFRNGRDPHFVRVWNDCRFQELHHRQQRVRKKRIVRRAVAEGRICLPFLNLTVETTKGRKLIRTDGPSRTPPPHLLRFARLSGKKHA